MQQIALFQAAGALSASQGRVIWPTNSRLRDKLWDDWGTNRTVTVWQTMQPLSDKLTSRCVTSYPSAFARTKTVSCMTSDSLTSCRCAVSKSRRRSVTNQRATAWQAMGWLRHKQNSHCVTNQADTISQTNYSLWHKLSVRIGDKQNKLLCNKSLSYKLLLRCQKVLDALCDQPKGDCVISYGMTEAQTEQSLCDKLCRYYLTN